MAYSQGGSITASDYNNLVGTPTGTPSNSNKALQAFASAAQANSKVAGLYGVGFSDRGYGQTALTLPNKVAATAVTSAEWTALRNAIAILASHQGTSVSNLVPTTSLETGDVVFAHDGVNNPNDSLSDLLASIDTNKLNTDSGASMTLSVAAHTVTRSTTWSSTINCTVQASWADANTARYFFNSGGELRIRLSQPTILTSQDTDWFNIFTSKVGTLSLKATSFTKSGSAGSVTNNGFYQLTTSNQTLYNGLNIGSGAYINNDVIVEVKAIGTSGLGAPGSGVEFTITLRDDHTPIGGGPDSVSASTVANFDVFRATAVLSGIVAPTFQTTDGL